MSFVYEELDSVLIFKFKIFDCSNLASFTVENLLNYVWFPGFVRMFDLLAVNVNSAILAIRKFWQRWTFLL